MQTDSFYLPSIADGEDKSSPLANCLRNNYRRLKKWAKKNSINCFRVYDREIRQFPLAIDFYAGRYCIHYYASVKDGDEPPPEMIQQTLQALKIVFNVQPDSSSIFWRIRAKKKETRQYEKVADSKQFFNIQEYGCEIRVNLVDNLDTGIFLDHRETRQYVAKLAQGKSLLNLFAYTCSFSVHAAKCGALFTKSVDMSNTYLDWGKNNFLQNSLSLENNLLVREDCLKFLDIEIVSRKRYDVIVIDPPTISRSKKMDQLFDIQEDYISFLKKSLQLLNNNGVIIFSTNSRKFKFDFSLFTECEINEITHLTLPNDFHDKKIHRCWQIKKKN